MKSEKDVGRRVRQRRRTHCFRCHEGADERRGDRRGTQRRANGNDRNRYEGSTGQHTAERGRRALSRRNFVGAAGMRRRPAVQDESGTESGGVEEENRQKEYRGTEFGAGRHCNSRNDPCTPDAMSLIEDFEGFNRPSGHVFADLALRNPAYGARHPSDGPFIVTRCGDSARRQCRCLRSRCDRGKGGPRNRSSVRRIRPYRGRSRSVCRWPRRSRLRGRGR